MKIVIDISELIYEHAVDHTEDSNDEWDAMRAIADGVVLPKGHDRLIYAEDVKQNHRRWIGYLDEDMIARLNIAIDKYVPTIIEADRDSLEWLGKNCKDCGNENCKKLGILPKEYDCALWQAKQGNNENDENVAAKYVEDQLHNAAQNIANKVALMLYAREQATLDEVLEAIHELEQENIGCDGSCEYESACKDFRAAVEALREVSE